MKFCFLIIILLNIGCQANKSPESALKSFINYRFSKNQNSKGLLSRTTGLLKQKIDNLDPEQMKDFLTPVLTKKKKIFFHLKKCERNKCFITYSLQYYQKVGNLKKDSIIKTKKIAEIVLENDEWKVADITDIKSYIDNRENIQIRN